MNNEQTSYGDGLTDSQVSDQASADEVASASTSTPAPTFNGVTGYTPMPIGGQAVMEGVMMRGKTVWAVAARDEQGEIHVEQHPLKTASSRNAWMQWPVIRGVVGLVESLALGTKSLAASARIAGLEEAEEGKEGQDRESAMTKGMMAVSMALGIGMAVVLFILLPTFLTQLVMGGGAENLFARNALDGAISIIIFLSYIYAISRMPDIKRVFQYHGAEHKVIHAVEAGDPLTVESAQKYDTMHNRCGTAFLVMVMVLAILVFSMVPVSAIVDALGITNYVAIFGIRIASRLLLLPLVVGLAYEVTVKWASKNTHLGIVKLIMWPGLQMQRLTTGEPDDDMVEVAIAATKSVLAAEQGMVEPESDSELASENGAKDDSGIAGGTTGEEIDKTVLPPLNPQPAPAGV
ncbi:MAG: DUF1385 domain-containing protein [Coriobacteriia bacterium]|nr:DUF1385 domain-containing protein [Coriobacteriia bacterium]MCL2870335.1 DUF1385 domain-containing protein [Coriobacteriia bacterium]